MYTAMDYTKNVILVIPQSNLSTYNTFVQNFGKKDYVFDDLTITVIPEGE
jgi:archaellum component FlaG (FlaF/FlaG flagellin family)